MLDASGGSFYRLVRIAMIRALELEMGAAPIIPTFANEKVTTIAVREIRQGRIGLATTKSNRAVIADVPIEPKQEVVEPEEVV